MKVSKLRIASVYHALVGILAAPLLSLPANAAWKLKTPPPAPRAGVAAEAINGIIYVAGGSDDSGLTPTLQAFDPTTNTWTTLADMPVSLRG